MSLFKEWNDAYEGQNDKTIQEFWKKYTSTEKRIYEVLLTRYPEAYKGVVSELAKEANADEVIFMGFLDGINESVKEAMDLESIERDTEINIEIDPEKLYFNMLDAKADYLYTLPMWDNILTETQKEEINRKYKDSKTYVREEAKIGRNDPCPCGSGKKYKKCCGKDL